MAQRWWGWDDSGLAWAPLDYEFDALAKHPVWAREFEDAADAFAQTLSPDLPAGLNAARQLFYVQHAHPQAWQRTRHLLPYPQYWAWRLCGERASEVSSLGCRTHLWLPQAGEFSQLASRRGWAALFAPVRSASEVLGTVRPQVSQTSGLPPHCVVHIGVHDSNACLARYLESLNRDATTSTALTVVSSGTWTVLMAPERPPRVCRPSATCWRMWTYWAAPRRPHASWAGGSLNVSLAGADPDAGGLGDLQSLISGAIMALPSFAAHGGPFRGREGGIRCGSKAFADAGSAGLAAGQRAALAALYCAQTTAWLVERLWSGSALPRTVLVEGPLARNALYLGALQGLMPAARCLVKPRPRWRERRRGAWMLSWWGHSTAADVMPVEALSVRRLE